MNKYLLAASVTAGLAVIGAPAFAQVSGTVGANYAQATDHSVDTDTYGVSGGVTIPVSGSLAVLVDGAYAHNDDADINAYNATAHLITRSKTSAWGGFAGYSRADVSGGSDVDAWNVGGEYAKFFDNSTIAVTLGYVNEDDLDANATGLLGEYRIFATDNLRVDFGAGFARVDNNIDNFNGSEFGAGVEYRFGSLPISIGANYTHFDAKSLDANVLGISLRYDFGNKSLKDRDRNGNTFGGLGGIASFIQ